MLVDLLLLAVLAQQTAQNAHAANPHHLGGEAGLTSTLALTRAGVATLALLGQTLVGAEAGVDRVGLADDEAILHQLANVLTCTRELADSRPIFEETNQERKME